MIEPIWRSNCLEHRGPDGTGIWTSRDGQWTLGHTRLSIIGLRNGSQPMASPDGAMHVVVNGEFYGYRELRESLRARGYRFSTESDSEIAVHLYRERGTEAATLLRGGRQSAAGCQRDRDARAVLYGIGRAPAVPQRPITGSPQKANIIAGVMTDNAVAAPPATDTAPPGRIAAEAGRRRTFAVISHPDAGKSTLTEALALHARAITEAGAVHGKAGRRSTVSDWMEMEKARGISITSTALQFPYRTCVINLLDTPGHADFSEDTYRVLTAVDSAVMLIDAAKGLEPQTLKLFQVCKHRRIPIITVINKWDRPGRHALELMDEIHARIGLRPTPLTWPVGIAGDFKGVLDRRTGNFIRFTRTAGGATAAPEEHIAAADAHAAAGVDWDTAVEESELLAADGSDYDREQFLSGASTPVLFTSAALNFGVNQLLDVLVDIAPPPDGAFDVDGTRRAVESPFSAFVFKVQAGMDSAHRDRIAYARVVSGTFERGDVLTHAATGKPFVTKYAQTVFGSNAPPWTLRGRVM